jgi:hypothetical protein
LWTREKGNKWDGEVGDAVDGMKIEYTMEIDMEMEDVEKKGSRVGGRKE